MIRNTPMRREVLISIGAVIFTFLIWRSFSTDVVRAARVIPGMNYSGESLQAQPSAGTFLQPDKRLEKGVFSSGTPLFEQLVEAGLSPQMVDRVVSALRGDVDFRSIREGVSWELLFIDDVPCQFTLLLDEVEMYDVFELFLNPLVVRRPISVFMEVQYYRGEIQTSLFDAFSNMPKGSSLAVKVSEVFAWDIDFFMDPRVGDQFEFMVESAFVERDGKREFLEYRRILAARYLGARGNFDAFLFLDEAGKDAYYNREGQSLVRSVLRSPLKLVRVTSGFKGQRFHPVLKKSRAHNGVDYGAPKNTAVMAVADGKVTQAGWMGQAGNAVVVAHKGNMVTQYFHLNSIPKSIRKGTVIRQGQTLGFVGKTGLATGYHLHFGMKIKGKYVNPLSQKFQPGTPIKSKRMPEFQLKIKEYETMYNSYSGPIQLASVHSSP